MWGEAQASGLRRDRSASDLCFSTQKIWSLGRSQSDPTYLSANRDINIYLPELLEVTWIFTLEF